MAGGRSDIQSPLRCAAFTRRARSKGSGTAPSSRSKAAGHAASMRTQDLFLPHSLSHLFCGRIGGPGGFLASSEGIDLSHKPLTDREIPLLPSLHVFVLAAQLGDLLWGVPLSVLLIGLALQFRYLEL